MKCDNAHTTVEESYDRDNFYSNRYESYAPNDGSFSHPSGYNRSTSGVNDWHKQSSSNSYDNVLSTRIHFRWTKKIIPLTKQIGWVRKLYC